MFYVCALESADYVTGVAMDLFRSIVGEGFSVIVLFVVSVLLFLSFPSFQTFVTCKHRQLRHAQALPRYRYVSASQSLKSVSQTPSLVEPFTRRSNELQHSKKCKEWAHVSMATHTLRERRYEWKRRIKTPKKNGHSCQSKTFSFSVFNFRFESAL